MTKEEREKAIDLLDNLIGMVEDNQDNDYDKALKMGIESLREEHCEDAVSRKAVFETIDDCNSDGLKGIFCSYDDGERFKEYIKKLPPITPTQRWIPVKERIPEESLNSVIGWDAYRERCVFVQYIDGHFQITGRNESFNITAWMPLPEPYKEIESE